MSAYILVSYNIADAKGYDGYVPGVVPLLKKHGAEILVADFEAKSLEGQARSVYVVLRFESEQAALRWYNDPDYEPLKKRRLESCTDNSLVLAKPSRPATG